MPERPPHGDAPQEGEPKPRHTGGFASDGASIGPAPAPKRAAAKPAASTAPLATAPIANRGAATSGMTRAGNVAHAMVMIVALLIEYVLVKVIWARLRTLGRVALLLLAQGLDVAARHWAGPYARFKQQALEVRNRTARLVLMSIIRLIEPLEGILSRLLGRAQTYSAKAAAVGAKQARAVLRPMIAAFMQAVQAGLQQQAVRKMAQRMLQILDEGMR